MTNAERQARYKQRLREAAQGVTAKMVVNAARILHEHIAQDDPGLGSWDEAVALSRQRRYRDNWPSSMPDDIRPDAYDFLTGDDRALVERVASVIHASRYPPPAE